MTPPPNDRLYIFMMNGVRLLDPRLFPAFVAVAELHNFTQAAEAAHMTQSGVSQHISKLEEQVGRPLFRRLGKTVTLTPAGEVLLSYVREQVKEVNNLFERIQLEEEQVSGLVSYAMPPSCMLSDHFTSILEKRGAHPDLNLKIITGSSSEILELVLRDDVDFGFVAGKHEHVAVTFDTFCEEECVLVSASRDLAAGRDPERLFDEPIVAFPGSEVYYDMWIRHTLPNARREARTLRRAGEINSIHAAILMVMAGLGCAVFPRHCIHKQLAAGQLFEHPSNAGPLKHHIYIARMTGCQPPRRVQWVLDWFKAMVQCSPRVSPVDYIDGARGSKAS